MLPALLQVTGRMALPGRIQPFLPRGTFQASIALCETLDSRRRTVQSRAARVCSQSLTIGGEQPPKLLTNPHFSPGALGSAACQRFLAERLKPLALLGFGREAGLGRDGRLSLVEHGSETSPKTITLLLQPAPMLGCGRFATLSRAIKAATSPKTITFQASD